MSFFDRLKDGFQLEDLTGLLEDLQSGKLDLGNLLNNDFINSNTNFANLPELLSKFGVSSTSELQTKIVEKPKTANKLIKENTDFDSLTDFVSAALKNKK